MTDLRITERVPLARQTTFGAGGPARWYAEPSTLGELEEALAWAAVREIAVVPLGLGSNLLVHDAGVEALVVRLAGALAAVEVADGLLRAGGGAANAVCLHHARRAGLGGFEFACAIPGTAGGGVRMNAGAYGSDWAQVLERALVVDAGGAAWRSAAELEFSYRHSAVGCGQVVAGAEFRLDPRPSEEIRVRVADLNARRKAAQPTNRRTFGSVFKNPAGDNGAGKLIELCGLKGWRIGGAVISPRHANFIENSGEALAADALALMVEARRRVREQFGIVLEHEVVLLGGLALPQAV